METIPLSTLTPNARNPRTITEKAFSKLCASIQRDPEFMRLRPIVVDGDGMILGGNQRYRACLHQEMTEVPAAWVIRTVDLTEEQRKRFVILDNGPEGASGEWDWDILGADWDIPELEALGMDISELPGTETDADAEPQIDQAEELNKKWQVKPGDLYAVGTHRLLCGDSTKQDDVARVLDGSVPLLMVTDPPYGVNYDPEWRAEAGVNKNQGKMGKVANDDVADWSAAWRLFPGDVAYIYHAGVMSSVVQASLEICGFKIRSQIIWAKDRMALSRGDYHWQHEPCWYAVRDDKAGHRTDDRTQTTLWTIPARDDAGHGHGTQKPLECMARPIRNHDARDVYDPFLGSGTTMVACQNLGRTCRGIEICAAYCAVILERMATAFPGIEIKKIA